VCVYIYTYTYMIPTPLRWKKRGWGPSENRLQFLVYTCILYIYTYPLSLRQNISGGAQLPRRPGRMQVVTHWAGRCVSSSSCESLGHRFKVVIPQKHMVFCSRSRKPEHISTPILFFLGQHIVFFWNLHEFGFVYLQMLLLQATKWLVLCIPSGPLWG
jgi:hypothetical protein